ncbi:MAG: hypothetical protein IT557_08600 [Alphaproteobacteria bacterium]|nr:hypothetical protein [Alphaproteobacteria bacterium]
MANDPTPSRAPARRDLLASMFGALPILAVAGQTASTQPLPIRGEAPTDIMPRFWAVYDRVDGQAPPERARALIADFFRPHIEIYRGAGVGRVDAVRWLALFDPVAPQVRALSATFSGLWQNQAGRFQHQLPDASTATPVVVLVSFLYFDARVRPWRERVSLFIGLDGVVRFGADLGTLLDHELFHLYHHQVNPSLILPGGDTLWLGIWKEGLAVYATGVLNQARSRAQILLGERALADGPSALMRRIAAELPPILDATDGATRARYLSYGYRGDIPQRSGYALGLAVVERVARGRSLPELARIPAGEIERILRAELAALAAG